MNRQLRLILAVTWSIAFAVACSDREATAPAPVPGGGFAAVITCEATVRTATLSCGPTAPAAAPGLNFDVTLGGQGIYVLLASSAVGYVSGTFSANVTVKNLTTQPMATTDGTTADAGGIKVFVHSGPTVTDGAPGTVVTVNSTSRDGLGTFTGSNQPYWQYSGVLAPGATSSSKQWKFDVPGGVNTFTFQVFVTTKLPADGSVLRWEQVTSPSSETLNGVRMNGGTSTGWAVGDNGTILRYDGTSTSWSAVTTPPALVGIDLYGVDASGGGEVYIVGDGGAIAHSADDGANWSVQNPVATALFSVQRLGGGSPDVYAVGANGVILYSADGTNWTPRNSGVEDLTDSLFITGGPGVDDFYAAGEGGTALHWNGTSWSPLSLVTSASIHFGDGTGDQTGLTNIWLVGTGGTIADSAAGGTWHTQTIGTQDLFGIRANNTFGAGATDVMVVGSGGTILHWNGVSWSAMASGTTANLKAVDTGDYNGSFTDWWAVGSGGTILHGIR